MQENHEITPAKNRIFMPLIIMTFLALGFVGGLGFKHFVPSFKSTHTAGGSDSTGSVDEILRFIQARYVDKISFEDLNEKTIRGLLSQLDPHSVYISKEELQSVNDEMNGDFEGVGIEFMLVRDTISVVSTIFGGPSEKAGVLAGDQIIYVNDTLVSGKKLDNSDIILKLRGRKGTKVKVGVKRPNKAGILSFTIIREAIPFNSIDAAMAIDDKTAYVKINRFSAKTFQEFMGAADSLFLKGKKENLILDLRQNPGGYLQEATNLLSQLIADRNKLLVYTKGRNFKKTEYETNGRSHFSVKKIAVLIDEGSASASEIVAGAIQDWDKGVIIGRRSFGKGLVQEQYDLQTGGALRLTIAKYYTPSGRCIQKDFDHYSDEIEERYKDGELSGKLKNNPKDSTKYFTSKGRVVYGSGGISPDIFIPIDTNLLSEQYFELRLAAAEFAIDEAKNFRKAYPASLSVFLADKIGQNKLFEKFQQKQKLSKFKNLQQYDRKLKNYLNARLAKQLYGQNAFFLIQNLEDEAVQKALMQFKATKLIPGL
ncbi:MAG TPA: S41 family peptidase [Saprospiraceae bacterium]|nr:S41 family peptidase [Saprospiraceae bacterium]HMX82848.1 S41 family peptidase [Saprospiraceae bacterium]HMZ73346.1 S41 family peptidase [Saprospiraceae bacterium]HNG12778.1 S41 family peptidase [Saprospiraceae bacterium]HNJ17113.1 S41 family peptidase [Saprospiraceae bacterium]